MISINDVVVHNEGRRGDSVNGIFRVVDVSGNQICLRAFNESGTFNYFEGLVEDYHVVV